MSIVILFKNRINVELPTVTPVYKRIPFNEGCTMVTENSFNNAIKMKKKFLQSCEELAKRTLKS